MENIDIVFRVTGAFIVDVEHDPIGCHTNEHAQYAGVSIVNEVHTHTHTRFQRRRMSPVQFVVVFDFIAYLLVKIIVMFVSFYQQALRSVEIDVYFQ
jgi:hypothetical protein